MTKKTFMGMVVVVGFFGFLFYWVDIRQLGRALSEVHIGSLAMGLLPQLLIIWIKSIRWAIAIRGATGRSVRGALSASIIGFAGNVLLPARLGELLRVGVINKHNHIGWSVALTTVGLTQLFDLLTLVGYFFLVSIWATSLLAAHRWEIGLLGVLVIVTLASLVGLQQKAKLLHTVLLPIHRKLPDVLKEYISRYTELFVKGLSVLGKAHLLGGLVLLTLAIWALETVSTYWILQAFHIEATRLMTALLVVCLNLSLVVPITPGNIGVAQAVSVLLLNAFGVAPASALAYSIGAQGAIQLLIVCLGVICLYREGMSLTLLRQRSPEALGMPTSTMEVGGVAGNPARLVE